MANQGDNKDGSRFTKKKDKVLQGIILIVLGSIFLLNNYGYTNIDIGKLWPLFLIIPGFFIIYRSSEK